MKNINRKVTAWSVAVLSLALVNSPRAENEKDAAAVQSPTQSSDRAASQTAGMPSDCNKATGIIGMEIKNQNDENLGRVRDVVFDLNSERVSYVVMGAKKGVLGLEEKYLAVPLSALKASSNAKYLILNADKVKVAAATGFERDNWPPIGSPSWGAEPFWQSQPQSDVPAVQPDQHLKDKNSDFPSTPTPSPAGVPPRAGAPGPTPQPD